MWTLILTLNSKNGCSIHSVPGFITRDAAVAAGHTWFRFWDTNEGTVSFHVVELR